MTLTAPFTPADPAFVADPYPAYAALRAAAALERAVGKLEDSGT